MRQDAPVNSLISNIKPYIMNYGELPLIAISITLRFHTFKTHNRSVASQYRSHRWEVSSQHDYGDYMARKSEGKISQYQAVSFFECSLGRGSGIVNQVDMF